MGYRSTIDWVELYCLARPRVVEVEDSARQKHKSR